MKKHSLLEWRLRGRALRTDKLNEDCLGGFGSRPCTFELRVAEWILGFVRDPVAAISTQPRAVIQLVQRSRVHGAVAFSARTHWHGNLVLFTHNLILHPGRFSSDIRSARVSQKQLLAIRHSVVLVIVCHIALTHVAPGQFGF